MSNEITPLFGNGAVIPSYLVSDELDPLTKKLASKSGSGLRISIKGNVWRMYEGGQQVAVHDRRDLDVVIVNASETEARTYYGGTYVEGEKRPPDCFSNNGVTPEAASPNRQSATCATCPQNVKGSATNGKSKACRYSRQLAVVLANDIGGRVFKLSVPGESLFGKGDGKTWPLNAYGTHVAAHRVRISRIVTNMQFDVNSATPKILFRPARPLDQHEIEIAEQQGQSIEAQEAVKNTVFAQDGGNIQSMTQALAYSQDEAEEEFSQPATIGKTAAVPAEAAPAPRRRAKAAEGEPVATVSTSMSPEQIQAEMAKLQAMMQQANGPVIKRSAKEEKAAATPAPAGAASTLAKWEDEEE